MANEIVQGVPILKIDAQYDDEVHASFEAEGDLYIKIVSEEDGMELGAFMTPKDARSLAHFILGKVGN